ncbi:MAG TPA: Na/Pi cotransporter family protein [bacterium]|nr:Na/Pi cotransporter family protein [bacterium]HMW31849.1 Na/Pi cotransporter family protein [bacterium]HMW36850.1 Na/Pi cotransporter family protein [bacterium]HMY35762.1 Na/Pi cotransporter family protein [bacterium]HMZ04559.1 Na/Pi cotransporter family protein [bacterium]
MRRLSNFILIMVLSLPLYSQDTLTLKNISYQPGQKLFVGLENEDLGAPLRVQLLNADGKPVSNRIVLFEIIERPSKSKGEKLGQAEAITNAEGMAETSFRLGDHAGDYIIIARTTGMTGDTPHIIVRAQRTMWWMFLIFGLIGGLGIFLYGMNLGSGGLQKVAGDRLRTILGALTSNRFLGLLVGIAVTAIVQSSSATSVMVVGLVSSALMTLQQAIGVLMGAHIGTTITVQLIAFNVSDYSLLLVGAGFLMTIATKRKFYIYMGEIILGFGFIFFGMAVMSQAINPLKSMPAFIAWLIEFGNSPILGILASTVFTAIIQSSGATIGLCVVMAGEGLLSLQSAMPLVFGANIGTCATALLSTIGATTDGKRTALAHTAFSVIGVFLFTPFLTPFESLIQSITSWMGTEAVARQIANGHMIFNIMTAMILIGFVPLMTQLITKIIPEKAEGDAFKPKYLNNAYLETPDIALQNAQREEVRLVTIVRAMYDNTMNLFSSENEEKVAKVREQLKQVNFLEGEIRRYLTRLSQKSISLTQSRRLMRLLLTIDDLRHMAERLGDSIANLAERYADNHVAFSPEGLEELKRFYGMIHERLDAVLTALEKEDAVMAEHIIKNKHMVSEEEVRLRQLHMTRLQGGNEQLFVSSQYHFDLLTALQRVHIFCVKMAHEIVEQHNL